MFRTAYDGKPVRVPLSFKKPSKTKQADKDRCDINRIMKNYASSGLITHVRSGSPLNDGDGIANMLPLAEDFQEAMNRVILAQNAFMSLDASVRKRFGNDPIEFARFAHDPENLDEMVKLGLAVRKEPPVSSPTEPGAGAAHSNPSEEEG